ncbi:hypothetical protein LTR78_009151 [Recurvomyces mirabilis]|uniref:Uncharacterized protein n=1 Tax=Recurvomyces mirabilis TaxID=574656 RepID=A0AAE0WIS4_9PEZI|nr:hypothetical protein LTR78_009151 [Recurvomyces mirabilis]KAK5161087.1 hypothetical protein LTS14_000883 [Recurvomyces mirabilis]
MPPQAVPAAASTISSSSFRMDKVLTDLESLRNTIREQEDKIEFQAKKITDLETERNRIQRLFHTEQDANDLLGDEELAQLDVAERKAKVLAEIKAAAKGVVVASGIGDLIGLGQALGWAEEGARGVDPVSVGMHH